jgi:hypothetical protein
MAYPSHSRSDLLHYLALQPPTTLLLPFLQFQNLLLSYMLDQHLLFLNKFYNLFQRYDHDHDGVLTKHQFSTMMDAAGLAENSQTFITILDFNQEARILFTKCV